jgi:HrpA-like RNA helicase
VTQPRRLAVVAVATHVASNLSGRDTTNNIDTTTSSSLSMIDSASSIVGYHVGQSNHSTRNTQLLFATAGILLGELRSQGPKLMDQYQCIVMDECHERSPENDLCLALIREFLASNKKLKARLVLMSATFEYAKYQSYFSERVSQCRSDGIPVVNLETAQSFHTTYENVDMYYLDDSHTQKLLSRPSRLCHDGVTSAGVMAAWKYIMKQDPNSDLHHRDGRLLSQPLLLCISLLVQSLDMDEAPDAVFLIFAPTYMHLEQIYEFLQNAWAKELNNGTVSKELSISVLHRSIDIEDCLRSMQQSASAQDTIYPPSLRPRRVLLASAIADSSITIPNVTCVIDTCRSLQVEWNLHREVHSSRTIWASQSICDQRKGRTGRTNPGKVFRLLPKDYFLDKLPAYEKPQLELSDCRNELLQLLTSTLVSSKSGNPTDLLAKTPDPPPTEVVEDAVQHLIRLGACDTKKSRNNSTVMTPTKLGRLLAELPFSVQEAVPILFAGQHGLLHEMLLLQSIESTRPYPVVRYFADEKKSQRALDQYFPQSGGSESNPMEIDPSVAAHMSAYMFWDSEWNKWRRWTAMESFLHQTAPGFDNTRSVGNESADKGVWKWSLEVEEAHIKWCNRYQINPTSVRAITETMDVAMGILYKAAFEPQWLYCADTEPLWRCSSSPEMVRADDQLFRMFDKVYGSSKETISQKIKCLRLGQTPYTGPNPGSATRLESSSRILCSYFLQGNCRFGDKCRNSHSLTEPNSQRQVCRFFLAGRCNKGNACSFAHSTMNQSADVHHLNGDHFAAVARLNTSTNLLPSLGLYEWFLVNAPSLYLFGEGDFWFAKVLKRIGFPPAMATTLNGRVDSDCGLSWMENVDITKVHVDHRLMATINEDYRRGKFRRCVWNFPYACDEDLHVHVHEETIQGAFMSLAQLFSMLMDPSQNSHFQLQPFIPEFGMALHGDQICRWAVQRSARRAGWKLKSWCPFDSNSFHGYAPRRSDGEKFPYQHARFYLFELQHRHGAKPDERKEECAIC